MTATLRLPYDGRDLDQILESLKSGASGLTPEWTDFLQSDVGMALLHTYAALTDMNAFYLDRQAAETFLSTCDRRSSAVAIAKSLGYAPRALTPATCLAKFSLQGPYNHSLTIPAHTTLEISGITFFTTEDAIIPDGQLETQVLLKQGSVFSTTLISPGIPWYKVYVPINVSELLVQVDSETWTEVDSFIYTTEPKCYKLGEDSRGRSIHFGGGVTADIPPSEAVVGVVGTLTSGSAGNIAESELAISIVDILYDVDGNVVTHLFQGETLEPAVSGSDNESLESIKENAPAVYTTQNRCVTASDYAAIARTVSGVEGVSAWGGEEVNRYGEVFICVYGSSRDMVPQSLLDSVAEALDQKRTVPMILRVVPPITLHVQPSCDIYLNQFATVASSKNQALQVIADFAYNLNIGQILQKSDLLNAVLQDPEMDYANIRFHCWMEGVLQSDTLDMILPKQVDPNTLVITDQGEKIWEYGEGTFSYKDDRLYVELEGNGTDVEIHFDSFFDDIYPQLDQLIVASSAIVNTFRTGEPK